MKSINQLTHSWAQDNNITSHFVTDIDSTNTWAKKDFKGATFAVFLADSQSHGRGRNQNTWTNSAGGGTLLSTWCLQASSSPQPIFPMRVGLALCESFAHVWPKLTFALKAPNDIYLAKGKLSGILVEVEQQGSGCKIYIGIGANIFAKPQSVGQVTSSLNDHANIEDEEWFNFCFHLSQNFRKLQLDPQRSHLTANEQSRLLTTLKKHSGNSITQINPDGGLTLANGTHIHWQDL